ncbi:DUF4232 domain-containing protein [Microlunatus soli]|uniref:DUF4232 domain-containing protein n=1 Tax=Microlunatus soli TaxID=630515 RepID=A0A1H1NET7_9ACTN|nr:DUF4232 domain-containing protein [Microlunatus soli]SDR97483.1 Protein of unknown function [Microlunatus soli]
MINFKKRIIASAAVAAAGLGVTAGTAVLPTADAAATPPAKASDLKITAKTIDNSSAGHHYAWLTFTNTSDHKVSLRGFSGTSFVAYDNGTQVGKSARWQHEHSPKTVVLSPGKKTKELVTMADPGVFGSGHTVTADGFRVYIPGSTAAVFVPYKTKVSTRNVEQLAVQPIGIPA